MNINTINSKEQQLKNGYFETGSGGEKILIIGSCRCVPYVQYFHDWNEENSNRFTIRFIDPFNFMYDLENNRVDMEEVINGLKSSEKMNNMLSEIDIFIHEFYKNFGMFNTNRDEYPSIYNYGMNAEIDICIPSWNDKFVLFHDIVAFDPEIRKKSIADYNVIGKLSDQTIREIREISNYNLQNFYSICEKSDIPTMRDAFEQLLNRNRFFHNSNHVSKWFTGAVFGDLARILGFEISDKLAVQIAQNDMYANIFTPLSEYDKFQWSEAIVPLRDKL